MLFKLHRNNLELNSCVISLLAPNAPTAAEEAGSQPEQKSLFISMKEPSSVLELLFQFMYNQPQPDLANLSFDNLLTLALAVEKYKVYSALECCKECMRYVRLASNQCPVFNFVCSNFLPEHALRILSYAVVHKHASLIDESAPHTVGAAIKDVQSALRPPYFTPWVCGIEARLEI